MVRQLYKPQLIVQVTEVASQVDPQRHSKTTKKDNKYWGKVFVSVHVVLPTAAMFLVSALNRGSHPSEILKMAINIWGGGEILLFRALANNMAP